jgi:hypothetical protein
VCTSQKRPALSRALELDVTGRVSFPMRRDAGEARLPAAPGSFDRSQLAQDQLPDWSGTHLMTRDLCALYDVRTVVRTLKAKEQLPCRH